MPLCPLPRAGANKRLVPVLLTRFRRWQAGENQSLWDEAVRRQQKSSEKPKTTPSNPEKSKEELPPTVVRQVEAAFAEGAYSKGLSLRNGVSKIAPMDSDTLTRLRALHPQGTPLQASPRAEPLFGDHDLTPKQVLRELRSFKPMAAPGPSGLRHTHLPEATDAPSPADKKRFKNLLVRWVQDSASGDLPSWCAPWLAGAKLIPLLKPCGGLRPIAVGEVLRRLISKVLQPRFSDQLAEVLSPLQLGVGVRGATAQTAR